MTPENCSPFNSKETERPLGGNFSERHEIVEEGGRTYYIKVLGSNSYKAENNIANPDFKITGGDPSTPYGILSFSRNRDKRALSFGEWTERVKEQVNFLVDDSSPFKRFIPRTFIVAGGTSEKPLIYIVQEQVKGSVIDPGEKTFLSDLKDFSEMVDGVLVSIVNQVETGKKIIRIPDIITLDTDEGTSSFRYSNMMHGSIDGRDGQFYFTDVYPNRMGNVWESLMMVGSIQSAIIHLDRDLYAVWCRDIGKDIVSSVDTSSRNFIKWYSNAYGFDSYEEALGELEKGRGGGTQLLGFAKKLYYYETKWGDKNEQSLREYFQWFDLRNSLNKKAGEARTACSKV